MAPDLCVKKTAVEIIDYLGTRTAAGSALGSSCSHLEKEKHDLKGEMDLLVGWRWKVRGRELVWSLNLGWMVVPGTEMGRTQEERVWVGKRLCLPFVGSWLRCLESILARRGRVGNGIEEPGTLRTDQGPRKKDWEPPACRQPLNPQT